MKLSTLFMVASAVALLTSCAPTEPVAPVVEKKPHELEAHGDVRIDDYYWLRERTNPEVLAYLEAENTYTAAMMGPTEELQAELFEELKNRIPPDESTVPALSDGYYYYKRYEKDLEYPIYCRREGSSEAPEEIILDANRVAESHDFCSVRGLAVSSDTNVLAWAVDNVGRRKYTIRLTNLSTGETMTDVIPEVTGNLDPTFSVNVWKTRSEKYIMIQSEQTLASEFRFLDADDPTGELRMIAPRERDVEYGVSHVGDRFIIKTNLDAENFRLMEAPVATPARENWRELIPGRDDVFIQGVEVFSDFMVVTERRDGLRHLRIIPFDGGEEYEIEFDEPAYVTWVDENHEFETSVLRYGYSSLNTPETIYDLDLVTRERTLMKQEQIRGGFDAANYSVERLMAPARDGVEVPISLVYRTGIERDGSNPTLLYAYGSYGSSMEAWFRPQVVSLLDRGFVYAIAHVRGGQELGRWWYEDGKLLKKKNTFTDFIDCGNFLVEEGYTAPERLFAMGGSAGGLLMGAVSNMAPELFAGIIAHVPWVDVVTTMLDEDIPLTTSEFDEWGDPKQREYYDYMLSYSPYDHVEAKGYPAMLVTTALEDSQVQYFEPAKWVAKLRAMKTDDNPLLLKIEMAAAGHGGVSGRFKKYHKTALEYAFMLEVLNGGL